MNSDYINTISQDDLQSINHVLVVEDGNSRQTIILEESEYSIGRDPRNKIALASKKISRFHATLLRRSDTRKKTFSFWLLDGDLHGNRSTNGIYINDKQCLVQELKHEDHILLGYEIQAKYYILSDLSELVGLQSKDFQGSDNALDSSFSSFNDGDNQKTGNLNTDKQTLVISEPSLESNDEEEHSSDLTKLASFPELSPNPIVEISWEGKITYLNPSAIKKFPELQTIESISDNHPLLAGLLEGIKNHGKNSNLFVREIQIKNQIFEQYIHYLADQKLIRNYIFDFTKRSKVLEAQLAEGEQRYKTVINQAKNGIFLIDIANNKILEANNAICDYLGYSINEIYNFDLLAIIANNKTQFVQELIEKFINNEQDYIKTNLTYKTKDNLSIELESSINLINYGDQKILFFDVHPADKNNYSQTIVQEQGLFDLETGLPNQQLFIEQLNTALANSHRHQSLLCVLFVELELLHNTKEELNYHLKLNILDGFAKRLRSSLRLGDTVARWHNNQFVVLLPQVVNIKDIGRICNRILKTLKPPFFLENKKIYTKTNLGIAIKEEEIHQGEILLSHARNALEKSKNNGGNNYKFFNAQTQKEIERLLRLEKLLEQALDLKEFSLDYQPQINFKTRKITGIEALIRWQHPELGKIEPNQFMPLAEETGLIVPIGEWVINTACQQRQIWQKNRVTDQPISVNISTQQLQQPNFVDMIAEILEKTQLSPELLELEITEKSIIADQILAENTIQKLRELGVRICLDDFGTGLSAIGFLKQFNFQTLKINENMVQNISKDSADLTIISAIISLGKTFNIRIVAEGVQNLSQLDLLDSAHCEEIQGDLLTNPLTMEDTTNFLANPQVNF